MLPPGERSPIEPIALVNGNQGVIWRQYNTSDALFRLRIARRILLFIGAKKRNGFLKHIENLGVSEADRNVVEMDKKEKSPLVRVIVLK